jgi:colanic acid/amylovoran biosynthesis glycosyltransferase
MLGEKARSITWLTKGTRDARLVIHLHGRLEDVHSNHDFTQTLWGADRIIAASHWIAHQISDLNKVVVQNGVPINEVISYRSPTSEMTIIGTACRLVSMKGITDLLSAFAKLSREFPNVRLEIAGRGPHQDDLIQEVNRLSLANCVRFLGWQRALGPILRTWDIFVLPSREDEGLPMAILEAMSEGLPVVASNVGGVREMVDHGSTGFLVPPRDPSNLARELRRLIVEPELRQIQGVTGRIKVRNYFSADRMVQKIQAVYDSLVSNGGAQIPIG